MKMIRRIKNLNYSLPASSIRKSFIAFMLIATLLPLAIGGMTSSTISRQMIQEEVSNFNKAWIEKQKDYLELLLQNIESMMDHIASIDNIKNALEAEESPSDNDTYLSTQATIGYILSSFNIDGLVSIDLISMNGTLYHVGETLDFQNINDKTKDIFFDMAIKSPDSIVWAGIEDNIAKDSAQKKVISAVKLIKKTDAETGKEKPVGLLIVNYNIGRSFYDHFSQNNLNENSILMVIAQDRKILFHPDKSKLGTNVNSDFTKKLTGKNGAFVTNFNGEKMFVVYSNAVEYGWTVLSYIPIDKLTESSKPILWYSAGAALLSFLLISIYALNLSRRVLDPISQITLTFKEIGTDQADLSKRLTVTANDEIGELVKWFNAFMENLADKKIMEEKLKQANEVLEFRVKERTKDLENLNLVLNNRNTEIQETLEKLKATQNQLIQREKLAGIGQLAAGIAHEINNPLGYVTSNMNSLHYYLGNIKNLLVLYQKLGSYLSDCKDENVKHLLQEAADFEEEHDLEFVLKELDDLSLDVNQGLSRVEKIVKNLRMFSWSEQEANFDEFYDLNKGIEDCLLIAQNEIKYSAVVEKDLGSIPYIEAIGSEINQVLLNMLVNAIHAIKMKETDELGLIRIKTWSGNGNVYLTIEDNGIGIPPKNLNRIFIPFFTTKPVGVGTGLGLSISYDIIVNQHHGQILVESEISQKTIFNIVLPIKQPKFEEVPS